MDVCGVVPCVGVNVWCGAWVNYVVLGVSVWCAVWVCVRGVMCGWTDVQ